MAKAFSIDEAILVNINGAPHHICPGCVEHVSGPPDEYHDCKNTFTNKKGENIGQCMCYGPAHGKRE